MTLSQKIKGIETVSIPFIAHCCCRTTNTKVVHTLLVPNEWESHLYYILHIDIMWEAVTRTFFGRRE